LYALNLSDIALKVCTILSFVIVEIQAVFCTQLVGVFIICLHPIFHTPGSGGSLVVIVVKMKAK
jgi:hypothetical protein